MNNFLRSAISCTFALGTMAAMALNINYELEPVSITPEDGSNIELGTRVELRYDTDISGTVVARTAEISSVNGRELETVDLQLLDNRTVAFDFNPSFGQSGNEYVVTIAKGAILNSSYTNGNPELKLHYVVGGGSTETGFTYTYLHPADNSIVKPGTKVTLGFDFEVYNDWLDVTIVGANGSYSTTLDYDFSDFTKVFFYFPSVMEDGDYTVTIPAGDISIDEEFVTVNQEIVLHYTVENEQGGGVFEPTQITPAQGTVESLPYIFNLSFDQEPIVAEGAKAVLLNTETNSSYEGTLRAFAAMNMVLIDMAYPAGSTNENGYLIYPGKYELSIPADVISNSNGDKNESMVYSWTIEGAPVLEDLNYVSFSPSGEVTSLSDVVITFAEEVTVNEGAVLNVLGNSYPLSASGKEVKATITPAITAAGVYNLTVEAGSIKNAAGHGNIAISVDVTVGQITYEIIEVNPDNSKPLAGFEADEQIRVVVSNANTVDYIIGSLWDNVTDEPADGLLMRRFNKQEDGSFLSTPIYPKVVMYEDHAYTLRLTLYKGTEGDNTELDILSYVYLGASAQPQSESKVMVLSVSPTPGKVINRTENVITFTFDAPVTFNAEKSYLTEGGQMAQTAKFASASSNSDKTEWYLTIGDKVFDTFMGEIGLMAMFNDEEGKMVKQIANESGYLYVSNIWDMVTMQPIESYICALYISYEAGDEAMVTPAPGSTVNELSEFTFTWVGEMSSSINWSYLLPVSALKVYNAEGEEVACGAEYISASEVGESVGDSNPWVKVILNTTITEEGVYTLEVPATMFSLGTEMAASVYKGQTETYIVESGTKVESILAGAESFDVYRADGVCVMRGATIDSLRQLGKGLFIINGKKVILK